MILSGLSELGRYRDLGPDMQMAVAYLRRGFSDIPPAGPMQSDCDGFIVWVEKYQTVDYDQSRYMAHRRCIEIHHLLEGEEMVYWNRSANLVASSAYDRESDLQWFEDGRRSNLFLLRPGITAVFYPEDAHKTRCKTGKSARAVCKLCVQIPLK